MAATLATPDAQAGDWLPDATFSDAYSAVVPGTVTARQAAQRMLSRQPRWIDALMAARNAIVAPFGIKSSASTTRIANRVGAFPVVSDAPDRLVAGFDDRHLDFRLIVVTQPDAAGTLVTATTIVRTHNLLGRAYLATILPFHKLIVRTLLGQL